jgi:hypothetical protein
MTIQMPTAIILCLLVTACATPQEAREKGLVASYVSSRSANEVSACIASAWESDYGLTNPVNVRPTRDGYTLQVSASGNTMVLLDVDDVQRGLHFQVLQGQCLA